MNLFPTIIPNWINGASSTSSATFEKISPANGQVLCRATRSSQTDVHHAVSVARDYFPTWSALPPVQRGLLLHKIVVAMQQQADDIAQVVALETGKSLKDAKGETQAAIQCGLFFASEGQRLYGKTTTSGASDKFAMTVRRPLGVAGLIISANTPIANVAWKVFPALVCGNTAILKASEDAPATSWLFGKIAFEAGLPSGALQIIQGIGSEAGAELVAHPHVDVISFTGSTAVGRVIQRVAGERFARVSLELGGKNPLIVCADADLPNAVKWTLLSAFSNAGQRCASASRVIVEESVYEEFKSMLIAATSKLKVGTQDEHDLGPVINQRQLNTMLSVVEQAVGRGAKTLIGGSRLTGADYDSGCYMAPTLIEGVDPSDELVRRELFGPIAVLFQAKNYEHALALANDCDYGLTACIHTKNVHRAMNFCQRIQAGVAVVNAGTFGSEPHMPFGGFKQSGNGTREPGTEALDVYTELQDVYIITDPAQY